MDPDALEDVASGQTPPRGDPVNGSSALADARLLWYELLGLTQNRFRLAAQETQRAGESLVTMIVAGVMVAALLSSAWLGLMAASVLELIEYGVRTNSAIVLAVAFNLLLALILYGVIRRKSRYLQFPATLRSLQPVPPGRSRDAEKS
jgi:uncharacterized membrane protein YqjE